MSNTEKKVTVRANGKCHPALLLSGNYLMLVCSCPGSQNGKLAKTAKIVCEGFEESNCRI
jgi:hypothetical protein